MSISRPNYIAKRDIHRGVSLREAMATFGLEPEDVIPDSQFHRFRDKGERPGRKGAWYIARSTNGGAPTFCSFGSWRRNISEVWSNGVMTDADRDFAVLAIKQRNQERSKEIARAAALATKLYNAATKAEIHPYADKKKLSSLPHARVDRKGNLVLPMRDARSDRIMSIQTISPTGEKKNLYRGKKSDSCLLIGPPPSDNQPVYVCEGYATAVTIHEATGHPAIAAWDCGNLEAIAKAVRIRYPSSSLVIAADNDQWTEGNPGVTAATRAAQITGAMLRIPTFKDTRKKPTDYNDLASIEGLKAVAVSLGVMEPPPACVLDPRDPLSMARRFLLDNYTHDGRSTLVHWRDDFYAWGGTHYPAIDHNELRSKIYLYLERAQRFAKSGELVPFSPSSGHVEAIMDALRAITYTPSSAVAPLWLDSRSFPPANETIALQNILLHPRTSSTLKHTHDFFTHTTLPFRYNKEAQAPNWQNFLTSLWPGERQEPSSISVLQEIFGYLVGGDTTHQKIFLIVGPPRSGKGTIARVLKELMGHENTAGPTLGTFAQNFGLQTLINKPIAIVSDARISGKVDHSVVVERLLSISGEDTLTIDRKHREPWTGQLPTRIVILTNEIPNLVDMSGALASRFVVLVTLNSFLGREDLGLFARLAPELPGILNWSLAGLARLRSRGHFLIPGDAAQVVEEMKALASPVQIFMNETCVRDPLAEVATGELYALWRRWCENHGRDRPSTEAVFGRDLRAVLPGLEVAARRQGGSRYRVYLGIKVARSP